MIMPTESIWVTELIGWVLTYLIHSTLLIALAFGVTRRLRGDPRSASVVWKLAMVGGLITVPVQLALGGAAVGPNFALRTGADPQMSPPLAVDAIPTTESPATNGEPMTVLADDQRRPNPPSVSQLPVATSMEASPDVKDLHASQHPTAAPPAPSSIGVPSGIIGQTPWLRWFAWVLLAGMSWGIVSLANAWLRLHRLLRGRELLETGPVPPLLQAICRAARVRRPRLTVAPHLCVPVATGLVRSEISVPARVLVELNRNEQESLLAHELGHICARDPLWRLIGFAIVRILFMQPLNRLANRELMATSELLADEWAARHIDSPLSLARCLTEVAGWFVERSALPVAMISGHRSQLATRVMRLVERPASSQRTRPSRWPAVAIIGALGGVVWAAPSVGGANSALAHDNRGGNTVVEPGSVTTVVVDANRGQVIVEYGEAPDDRVVARISLSPEHNGLGDRELDGRRGPRARKGTTVARRNANRRRRRTERDRERTERKRSRRDRERANRDRERAKRDRERAKRDRERANRDRERTKRDRERANRDRERANRDRQQAERAHAARARQDLAQSVRSNRHRAHTSELANDQHRDQQAVHRNDAAARASATAELERDRREHFAAMVLFVEQQRLATKIAAKDRAHAHAKASAEQGRHQREHARELAMQQLLSVKRARAMVEQVRRRAAVEAWLSSMTRGSGSLFDQELIHIDKLLAGHTWRQVEIAMDEAKRRTMPAKPNVLREPAQIGAKAKSSERCKRSTRKSDV